ncbi:transposase [Streptomyces sp. T12]|uniref:transposase n=1 Tax=Streptomyces sp. T12 TaxID=477697 RepID=UPI00119D2292
MPLGIIATPGNVNDSTVFDRSWTRRVSADRPCRRPKAVIAVRAYSSRTIWPGIRRRGIRAVIPERSDHSPAESARIGRRGSHQPRTKAVKVPHRSRTSLQQAGPP